MARRIALFNHKGGVSKTTTTFNLAWMLAAKGKTTIMVDTDPQCNLTGLVLGYKGPDELDRFYAQEQGRNIRAGLAPAFESKPELIRAIDCVPVAGNDQLFLLPGHIRLAEYEVTLGIAQELTGTIQTLQNLPGALTFLLDKTADGLKADYVLIDMSPSLSSINQNVLMTSHYFIVPTSPDYFSVMAIESLASFLPGWYRWSTQAQTTAVLRDATYPYPLVTPRFLGTIAQRFRLRAGNPATAFQEWIDRIGHKVRETLIPALKECGMVLPEEAYGANTIEADYCLAEISDFNSLIARSQECQTPVFALSEAQMGHVGVVLDKDIQDSARFHSLFSELADRVIGMTAYEVSG